MVTVIINVTVNKVKINALFEKRKEEPWRFKVLPKGLKC